MKQTEIDKLLLQLDGRGSDAEYDAINQLKKLGDKLPELLLAKYRSSRKWGERNSCVYHASKFARSSNSAFRLGIEALQDKSKNVRYQACLLLAVAQRNEAIRPLKNLLGDMDSSDDAAAAISAIKEQNYNYFVDRDHSGMVTLNV